MAKPIAKMCAICENVKPIKQFTRNSKMRDGRSRGCQDCTRTVGTPSPAQARETHLQNTYGISQAIYLDMLESQEGCCAICSKHVDDTYNGLLDVDHNHETGEVRGLLCRSCNTALGKFQDSPKILNSAVEYLKANGDYSKGDS